MKMMMPTTKVRFERPPITLPMIVRMSLSDFQFLASLKTLKRRNDRSIETPVKISSSSTIEKITITKSKLFQAS